jgi:hypothetical protein
MMLADELKCPWIRGYGHQETPSFVRRMRNRGSVSTRFSGPPERRPQKPGWF